MTCLDPPWDIMTWKQFMHYCPFVRRIHLSPMDFPHKGSVTPALICTLMLALTKCHCNEAVPSSLNSCQVPHHSITPLHMALVSNKGFSPINILRPRDNIFKFIYLNEIVWILIRFLWSLFTRAQSTIFQDWFRQWFGAGQVTSHYQNQWWSGYWPIHRLLGLNESTR